MNSERTPFPRSSLDRAAGWLATSRGRELRAAATLTHAIPGAVLEVTFGGGADGDGLRLLVAGHPSGGADLRPCDLRVALARMRGIGGSAGVAGLPLDVRSVELAGPGVVDLGGGLWSFPWRSDAAVLFSVELPPDHLEGLLDELAEEAPGARGWRVGAVEVDVHHDPLTMVSVVYGLVGPGAAAPLRGLHERLLVEELLWLAASPT